MPVNAGETRQDFSSILEKTMEVNVPVSWIPEPLAGCPGSPKAEPICDAAVRIEQNRLEILAFLLDSKIANWEGAIAMAADAKALTGINENVKQVKIILIKLLGEVRSVRKGFPDGISGWDMIYGQNMGGATTTANATLKSRIDRLAAMQNDISIRLFRKRKIP